MSDKIRIVGLGGLDEEGKECAVVEINDDIFVINCGVRQADRTMPGVDYVIPRYDYLEENKKKVKAYFLLHGHDDAVGALLYIYDQAPAPIYCSKVTKEMLLNFARHVGKDISKFEFVTVPPTSSFVVAKRRINFFHTAHNVADSSGIAISTDKGNIVYVDDFVVENNGTPSFLFDSRALGRIAEEPTLLLMTESLYATRQGYTAPNYRLTPLIAQNFKSAPGRIFISLFSSNFFNVGEAIALAIENHKKIIPYDEITADLLDTMEKCGQVTIPNSSRASMDDLLRLKDQDIVVLISAFGGKLFRKIALLASHENEDKRVRIKPEDTFFWASPSDDNTELEYTDAIDELYRTGCTVYNISKKAFLRMHASQEDLKTVISILRPKYYLPVRGLYKDLLANGMLALSMGVGLNHSNVFVVENGASVLIDEKGGARVFDEKIPHGDLMIDGEGVGDVSETVLEDRQQLGEGVIMLAITVSRSKRKIVAGPDIQMRGFVYAKDAKLVQREVGEIFVSTVVEYLEAEHYDIEKIRQNVYERCLRAIRRLTGKQPMVLPLIIEVA